MCLLEVADMQGCNSPSNVWFHFAANLADTAYSSLREDLEGCPILRQWGDEFKGRTRSASPLS